MNHQILQTGPWSRFNLVSVGLSVKFNETVKNKRFLIKNK